MEFDARHPFRTITRLDTVTAALIVQFLVSVSFNLMGSFMPLFISSELNQTLIEATGWTGASSFIASTIMAITAPARAPKESETRAFNLSDLRTLFPDITALILVYMCISFLFPTVSWFLSSLGVPDDQLLLWTTAATVLNGIAFAVATPVMTKVMTNKIMPWLSVGASAAIKMTAFVFNPLQFITLRIVIGGLQAGIPPNLLGGKSGRKGTGMGFLNSARFLGMAIGPIMATTILGDGTRQGAFNMFTVMAGVSLVTAVFIYLTHRKKVEE